MPPSLSRRRKTPTKRVVNLNNACCRFLHKIGGSDRVMETKRDDDLF